MPVESLDFGLLMGDVVPRDGLQRPLLTSGSPVHAPAPRRASKQPINVTHVHQTVVQNFGASFAACPTPVAEGTSGLACLEDALAVPRGSVYAPASRWKHRSKAQVAAGAAPHQHDGAMAYGTNISTSLHAPTSDVTAMDDDLDSLAMPIATHVPGTSSLTVATPAVPQHVLDVMARVRVLQHEQCRPTPECTPTVLPPATQVGGGPVAEAIARHFAVKAEGSEAARKSAQAERDSCYATARLLARAGWHERAEAAIAAAPTPARAAPPLPPAIEGIVSLRPIARRGTMPTQLAPSQETAVGAWRGSLVAASSLRPPPAGETLTPVQVAVAGVVDLPPGERRARVASLAAAARLVAYMSATQVNTLLGRPACLPTSGQATGLR